MKTYQTLLAEAQPWAKEVFEKIDKKLSQMTLRSYDKLPDGTTPDGFHKEKSICWWTNGFWGGTNHLMYMQTGNEDYLKTARRSEVKLDEALFHNVQGLHHDVGFMWHLTSGINARLYSDKESRNRNLLAASSLSSRFVLGGNFIRAWNGPTWGGLPVDNWTIVDCMMNLPLLYWASEEIGDDRFKRIAMAHADMCMRDHVRPDGSVVHIVEHDRETGECVATYGGQGCAVGSSWSRGQAWGLYGFVLSYLHTGEVKYLDTAKRIANYFIANCSDDWLPRVDFRAPAEPVMYDSTAGACAACGLIELAKQLPENEGGMYMHAAVKILQALTENFVDWDPANDHMLGYGTVRYPVYGNLVKAEVHVSIIYAEYFYTEAILKLLGMEFNPW